MPELAPVSRPPGPCLRCTLVGGVTLDGVARVGGLAPGRAPPPAAPPRRPAVPARPNTAPTDHPVCPRLETTAFERSTRRQRRTPRRPVPPLPGRSRPATKRARSRHRAGQAHGLRLLRLLSLFNNRSAQCGPVNNQIQQMRGNLDQITGNLERLRSGTFGGDDRENQRRSVMTALAQNNCGPQYATTPRHLRKAATSWPICSAAAMRRARRRSAISVRHRAPIARCACAPATAAISRSPLQRCRRASPTTRRPARRCARRRKPHSTPIAIPERTSIRRSRSTASPTRRCRTRSTIAPSSIRPAPAGRGQTWSDALKTIDDTAAAQQGDIIVTEESAKKMQQRAQQPRQGTRIEKGCAAAGRCCDRAGSRRDAGAAGGGGLLRRQTDRSVASSSCPTNATVRRATLCQPPWERQSLPGKPLYLAGSG